MAEFKPEWPSLEQQLRDAKVISGSALEQLILDNQDFEMLRPEEANDDLGFPPWLRVYWRKQHPERAHPPHDPTGGYPRVLEEVYSWMRTHQDLPGVFDNPDDLPKPMASQS